MGDHPIEDSNTSSNPTFAGVVDKRLSRRDVLKGSASAATVGLLSSIGLAACDGDDSGSSTADTGDSGSLDITSGPDSLGFQAVPTSLEDRVEVPAGYRAEVLIARGDPISPGVSPSQNDGTDVDFDQRSGDEHDGMHLFTMNANGERDPEATDRGILCTNHENLETDTLHPNGPTAAADNGGRRPRTEVDREMNAHGVSCVEIRKTAGSTGRWEYVQDSAFNRRVTVFTEVEIAGPVRGADFLKTKADPEGTTRRGTLNNCAHGFTPWGTYLAAEENFQSYWNRGDDAGVRSAKEEERIERHGIVPNSQGFSYREWDTVQGEVYERFNVTATGADGTEDFRNEPNRFGYMVEIDPFRPGQKPKVRTAFGRFAHEGAWPGVVETGKPIVYYMGDDSRSEYIYKFVSNRNWDPADANGGLSAGDKYLDDGTLYVAVFNADGTGEWKELSFGINGLDASNSGFPFENQADVLAAARVAADTVGATKMDRPEWGAVSPINGDVYMALTNNRPNDRFTGRNAANPRFYEDAIPPVTEDDIGNPAGHIIRWREDGDDAAATAFRWDIFLFSAEAGSDPNNINLSGLTAENEFDAPDGLHFDQRGVLWIETDGDFMDNKTNDQLLAALPHLGSRAGDGEPTSVAATVAAPDGSITVGDTQSTFVGVSDASSVQLQRFLTGVTGCEITGIIVTPDARTLFCNIQHPRGTWPAPSGDATQQNTADDRPRSATIMVYREDGGEIGL